MKLNPEIYRKAANDLINADFIVGCCYHINQRTTRQLDYRDNDYILAFHVIFAGNKDIDNYYFGKTIPKNKLQRAIALDLMAEIIEDEQKTKQRKKV